MPIYNYKALKQDGTTDLGVIDADSPKDARVKLRSKNLHVTDIEQVGGEKKEKAEEKGKEKEKSKVRAILPPMPDIFARRNIGELAIITRQLATLLNSGIPLMGSLTAVIEQMDDRRTKAIFMGVREKVGQGASFGNALAANPKYFSELYINMVKAGEASGNLDAVLFKIADYLQTQSRIRAKVIAAMTYPIIMMIVGASVVIFLLVAVVPKIAEALIKKQHNAALPLPTRVLMGTSNFLAIYWWIFVILAVGLYILYQSIVATPKGRLAVDTFILKIPIFGPLVKKSAISRFSVTFATLLESGLPVLDSLDVVKRIVNNSLLSNTIDMVKARVSEGADISTPIKNSKIFPPVVGYMIAVGEESGRLEDLLRKISIAYDEEVDIATQKLTSLLEPVTIVVMAVIVGFIVLSILLPILQMSKIG